MPPVSFEMPEPSAAPTPEEHRMTPHYAAPPSRPASLSEYAGNKYEDDPRRVRLSIEEQAVARASGISDIDYARNKIRLQQATQKTPTNFGVAVDA